MYNVGAGGGNSFQALNGLAFRRKVGQGVGRTDARAVLQCGRGRNGDYCLTTRRHRHPYFRALTPFVIYKLCVTTGQRMAGEAGVLCTYPMVRLIPWNRVVCLCVTSLTENEPTETVFRLWVVFCMSVLLPRFIPCQGIILRKHILLPSSGIKINK